MIFPRFWEREVTNQPSFGWSGVTQPHENSETDAHKTKMEAAASQTFKLLNTEFFRTKDCWRVLEPGDPLALNCTYVRR